MYKEFEDNINKKKEKSSNIAKISLAKYLLKSLKKFLNLNMPLKVSKITLTLKKKRIQTFIFFISTIGFSPYKF